MGTTRRRAALSSRLNDLEGPTHGCRWPVTRPRRRRGTRGPRQSGASHASEASPHAQAADIRPLREGNQNIDAASCRRDELGREYRGVIQNLELVRFVGMQVAVALRRRHVSSSSKR